MTAELAADQPSDTLTDAQCDLAERIEGLLRTKAVEKTWTPSEVAQRLRVDTATARTVLLWMARYLYVRTYGEGARTRYGRWVSGR